MLFIFVILSIFMYFIYFIYNLAIYTEYFLFLKIYILIIFTIIGFSFIIKSYKNYIIKTIVNLPATENDSCSMCVTNRRNSFFLHGDTAHQVSCYDCALKCGELCPLCRQEVDKIVRLY